MNTVKINNEVNLTYPESFNEMSDEELARYFGKPDDRWGAYDADRHIILSVSWAKAGFMSSDPEMVVAGAEARLRRNLLNYQRISEFKTKIASKKTYGIRFEYRVNDARIVQVADLMTFKYKKNFYSVYYITRKSTAAADRADFEEIVKSISLG